jgi:hypothetical protein
LAFACDSGFGFTKGFFMPGVGAGAGVASCGIPPKGGIKANVTRIAAEKSRNDFHITASSSADAVNWHPFEPIEFLARIIGPMAGKGYEECTRCTSFIHLLVPGREAHRGVIHAGIPAAVRAELFPGIFPQGSCTVKFEAAALRGA